MSSPLTPVIPSSANNCPSVYPQAEDNAPGPADELAGWFSQLPLHDQFALTLAVQSYQPEWLMDTQSDDEFCSDLLACGIGLGQFDLLEPSSVLQHAFEHLQYEVVEAVDSTPSAPPPTPSEENNSPSATTRQPPECTRWSKRVRKPRVIWTPDVTVSPRKRKSESSSLGVNVKKAKLDVEVVSANHSASKPNRRVVRTFRPGTRSSPRGQAAPKSL